MKAASILRLAFCTLLILVLGVNTLYLPHASATLSPTDIEAILRNTPFYTSEDSTTYCAGSSVILTGSENAEKVFNFLLSKQLTPPQVAGIMGNLQAESGFNPRRVQNTPTPSGDRDDMVIGTSVGFGLAQWTTEGRQQGLHNAAVAAQTKDSDLSVQLNYLWSELTNDYYKKNTLTPLMATQDVREATSIVMINFEGPKDQSQSAQNARAALSLAILAKYGSGATTATTTNPVSSSCANSAAGNAISGDYSLPVDKSFYDKKKSDFTKPHHDYPAADIPLPVGTPVFSITTGKVVKAPAGGGCGIGVIIDTGNGVRIAYCHGSDGGSIDGARVGDTVKPGQLIMHSASTGNSDGPHLHVAITISNTYHCPQTLFVGIVENNVPSLESLPTTGCSY